MAPLATHERLILFADKSTDPPAAAATSYQLLALPPALLALLTASHTAPLEFRGDPHDSAVLVTPTQTYAVRGVQNSNSLCVCASGEATGRGRKHWFVLGSGGDDDDGEVAEDPLDGEGEPARKKARHEAVEIEAVLHETLEAVPGVARTDKLDGLLKGAEYLGDAAEESAKNEQVRPLCLSAPDPRPGADPAFAPRTPRASRSTRSAPDFQHPTPRSSSPCLAAASSPSTTTCALSLPPSSSPSCLRSSRRCHYPPTSPMAKLR